VKSAASSFRDYGAIEAENIFLRLLYKKENYRQRKNTLLRCVTTSLSLKKYLLTPELVCNRDTTNFSPRYNGAQKLLYINCVLHKRS
jgi:hypothetical protein